MALLANGSMKNKAGYTANTSCGRVGRGGNARFHTFQLDHHGPTNRPTDQLTNGRTDKASYRVACPRLKNQKTNQHMDLMIQRHFRQLSEKNMHSKEVIIQAFCHC